MRATASVTLRVTNSMPRGDSWLNRMPLEACRPKLAIVDGDPVAIELGHAVGAARVERRVLVLALGLDQAEHLAGGSLVEARFRAERRIASSRWVTPTVDAGGHRLVPGSPDEALCRRVVDLLRLRDHRALHRTGIGHVAVLVLDIAFDPQFAQAPARVLLRRATRPTR